MRDLRGTMEREGAKLGILIAMNERALTRGTRKELAHKTVAIAGKTYPDIQAWTIEDFLPRIYPNFPRCFLSLEAGNET